MTKQLTTTQAQLPATIEELSKFVLVGREKLNSVRAEIRAIDKIQLATEVRDQKRDEARMLSEALLDAEVKLGDMMKAIPKDQSFRGNQFKEVNSQQCEPSTSANKTKKQIISDLGFNKDQVSRFETLADNKDLVEQVKAQAREEDDLPTRSQVLSLAKARNDRFDRDMKQIDADHDNYKKYRSAFRGIDYLPEESDFLDSVIRAATLEEKELELYEDDDGLSIEIEYLNGYIDRLTQIRSYFLSIKAKGGLNGKK